MCSDKTIQADLTITSVGHRGDGIASHEGRSIYVPFTLPGEHVRADITGSRGSVAEVLEASPSRIEPICDHFETCGGCLLQHMAPDAYLAFKHEIVVNALQNHGLDLPVEMPVAISTSARRRAVFSAKRQKNGRLSFGFAGRRSHTIVDIQSCPILLPALANRLEDLRAIAGIACSAKKVLKLHATATETGLDVLLVDGKEDERTRQHLAEETLRRKIARISFPTDTIVEPISPRLMIEGTAITPRPGTFLQATADSEDILANLVVDTFRTAGAKNVVDLFSGFGAFSLRLAHLAKVTAVDSDADALFSLDQALRFATGLKTVKSIRRDLFRNPYTTKELNLFDAIVFDPPRAGAERQAYEISQSKVKTVVAISCNPLTLAADLSTLVAGGYTVRTIRPVDQFVFSPHIETIAVCVREA